MRISSNHQYHMISSVNAEFENGFEENLNLRFSFETGPIWIWFIAPSKACFRVNIEVVEPIISSVAQFHTYNTFT